MIVLADYNLNRQAILLSGSLVTGGWLDLAPMQLMTFAGIGLSADSNERVVWIFAQTNGMLLLTANQNAKGEDSLEQVMREENQSTLFPIITIGDPDRVNEFDYQEHCDIQDYMGSGRRDRRHGS